MKYSNYSDIRDHLIENEPFVGNTMSAYISRYTDRNGVPREKYVVWSYHTVLYEEHGGRCTFWNSEWYSVTTRRHQGIISAVKGKKISELQNSYTRVDGGIYHADV